MKARVIHGFTDKEAKKNYQDNEIIDISEKRFEELKGVYLEKYEEPVVEADNAELQKEIESLKIKNEELELALVKANEVPKNAKDLKAANEELTAAKEALEKEVEELKAQVESLTKDGENDGQVQE